MTEAATPKDRAHFAAIAAAESDAEEDSFRRAAVTPPGERMLQGFKLGAVMRWNAAFLAEVDARADGQMELARRRIALSLGRR